MAKIFYISGVSKKSARIGEVITAQSVPDLDEWGIDSYWGCADWMAWHIELVKSVGVAAANTIWLQAWEKQTFGAYANDWCKFDKNFTNYLISVGLLDPSEAGMILPNVINAGGTVVDAAGNVIQNTAGAASTLSSLIKPAAILFLLGAGYYGYNKYLKSGKK